MVFNVSTESGRAAMPRCTCATSSGDILRIMRSAPSTKSGRISRVFFARTLRNHGFEKRFGAAFENIVRRLQAPGARFRTIGRRFGVAQSERSHATAMFSPELEQRVAADRDADQRSAADFGVVHHARDVGGVFLHRGRTFADAGIAVPAQIRQHKAIPRGQSFGHRQPEFMIDRKRMQQDHRRAVAERPVDDFGVAALDALGRRCAPCWRLNHKCGSRLSARLSPEI